MSAMAAALRIIRLGTMFGYGEVDTAGHCFTADVYVRHDLGDALTTLLRRSEPENFDKSAKVIAPLLIRQHGWTRYEEQYDLNEQGPLALLNGRRLQQALGTGEFHYALLMLAPEWFLGEDGAAEFTELVPHFYPGLRVELRPPGEQPMTKAGPIAPKTDLESIVLRRSPAGRYEYLRGMIAAARDLSEFLLASGGVKEFANGPLGRDRRAQCRCTYDRFQWRRNKAIDDAVFGSHLLSNPGAYGF